MDGDRWADEQSSVHHKARCLGRDSIPGVSVSLVGDEHWGHGPDTKHLSDGGLQKEEVGPITNSWCPAETYILVNLLMELLLYLRARAMYMMTRVLKPKRNMGLAKPNTHMQKSLKRYFPVGALQPSPCF